MRENPVFLNEIQDNAHRRWEQLEADDELAGPWHQLFNQVQSPRHVLSELLQNADDAGAQSARARIEDGVFIFEHDGEDFKREHFESLCRFGLSNKRNLHTIGFRGIGFKSTFSLGPVVEVVTPTIAVKFERARFTEPIPISQINGSEYTQISVKIENDLCKGELQKNLDEWSKNPVSLLFFHNIKKLTISDNTIERQNVGPGPVPNSERIRLNSKESYDVIIIRSEEEPFPAEAIEEIKRERITADANFELTPTRVEIVVGLSGDQRLYVILPTEVRFNLPFSCNAPFVQDPARVGIKDPARSLTNRWLLERLGNLAASSMIAWIGSPEGSISERVKGYCLLSDTVTDSSSLADECANAIKTGFSKRIGNSPAILLTSHEELVPPEKCLVPPYELYSIWSPYQILELFASPEKQVLVPDITEETRKRLVHWRWLSIIEMQTFVDRLVEFTRIPKPDTWENLTCLWAILQNRLQGDYQGVKRKKLNVIPVEGRRYMSSSNEVIRAGSIPKGLSDEDWQFLLMRLNILDRSLVIFLSNRIPDNDADECSKVRSSAAEFLRIVGLSDATSLEQIVIGAFRALAENEERTLPNLVKVTHICAMYNITAPQDFQFYTKDGKLRTIAEHTVYDPDGEIESLIPKELAERSLIHDDYSTQWAIRNLQQWNSWACSPKSRLRGFLGIIRYSKDISLKSTLKDFVEKHNGRLPFQLPLQRQQFEISDVSFDNSVYAHWSELEKTDPKIWISIIRMIAEDPSEQWKENLKVKVWQIGNWNHNLKAPNKKIIDCGALVPTWVQVLRSKSCIPDTHEIASRPSELLLRNPQTEVLQGIERFVHSDYDIPANKELLVILGVRDTPSGFDKFIERLRLLSKMKSPPTDEIIRYYSLLDQILPRGSQKDLQEITSLFAKEALTFTRDGNWCTSKEVFLQADEEILPGTHIIHPSVQTLSFWVRIGVAQRPSIPLILTWLKTLATGHKFDQNQFKQIRALLQRAPNQVWEDCQHWINLDQCWVPVDDLKYMVSMQTLVPTKELFPMVRARTANFQMLPEELTSHAPFSSLSSLRSRLQHKVTQKTSSQRAVEKTWLQVIALNLARVKSEDPKKGELIRSLACRLSETRWQPVEQMTIAPYIDGTPAGQPHACNAFWENTVLFVRDVPLYEIVNDVTEELSQAFEDPKISTAFKICFEKERSFIEGYFKKNFELLPDFPMEKEAGPSESDSPIKKESAAEQTSVAEPEIPVPEICVTNPLTELSPDIPDKSSESPPEEKPEKENEPVEAPQAPESKPPRHDLPLIDLYAFQRGYIYDSTTRHYKHPDGFWIQPAESPFSWELYEPGGTLVRKYWVVKQILDNVGVELPADLWALIKLDPLKTGMILIGNDNLPAEYPGTELITDEHNGELILHPAKYRLQRKSD